MFQKIDENLARSQFQTAVLLYKFLEEKKIPSKIDVKEFSELYDKFKKVAVDRMDRGVDNMLTTWLNYCSSKQKEISDKAYKKIDPVLKILYAGGTKQRGILQ